MTIGTGHAYRREAGFALVFAIVILALATLSMTLAALNAVAPRLPTQREALTRAVLEEAKAALVAFAAENRHRPGGLPCPDRDGDGEAELACDRPEQRIGLLPWQTLKSGPLRDASGTPLWYAVSAAFRNDPDVAINSLVDGDLPVIGSDDRSAMTVVARAVAVVIAANAPLPGQTRDTVVAARRADFLENEHAAARPRFHLRPTPAGNDAITVLTADELFAVVDPVVASRMRREIAPLFVARYVERWRTFPYAVPFENPATSPLVDEAHTASGAGLLPVGAEPAWVRWDLRTADVRAIGGDGRVLSFDCARSLATELRCTVDHAGAVEIELAADALNVGYALVEPPEVATNDFGPASLGIRTIEAGVVRPDGSARIVARATLPATGRTSRLHLVAPKPIRELSERRLAVAEPGAWFGRNAWYRTLMLVASPPHLPGASRAADCTRSEACIEISSATGSTLAPAGLVYTGRPRSAPVPVGERFLEGPNARPWNGHLLEPASRAAGNDAVMPLCPAVLTPCVPGA